MNKCYKRNAFTLAEVLIALVVIGIIAAITLTTVMPNIQERVNSQRQANIVYKVTQATNLMKANGAMINGFESTDAFVDELQKYLKIMKRCDSEHIADCWPTKTVTNAAGKKYDISDAKTRGELGYTNDTSNNNVAIVLADGAPILLTYDSTKKGMGIGDLNKLYGVALPVGNGYKEYLEYSSTAMENVGFIMDVNGGKGPNFESTLTKWKDIRSFNDAKLTESCTGVKSGGKCYTFLMDGAYSPLNCKSHEGMTDEDIALCDGSTYSSYDYWAGARAKCATIGADLAKWDDSKMGTGTEFCNALKNSSNNGYPTNCFWIFEHTNERGYIVFIQSSGCTKYTASVQPRGSMGRGAICIK